MRSFIIIRQRLCWPYFGGYRLVSAKGNNQSPPVGQGLGHVNGYYLPGIFLHSNYLPFRLVQFYSSFICFYTGYAGASHKAYPEYAYLQSSQRDQYLFSSLDWRRNRGFDARASIWKFSIWLVVLLLYLTTLEVYNNHSYLQNIGYLNKYQIGKEQIS